jgi:hypothetical protein
LVSSIAQIGVGPEPGELAASRGNDWVSINRVAGAQGEDAQISWDASGWPGGVKQGSMIWLAAVQRHALASW